jgi:nitrile hydratase
MVNLLLKQGFVTAAEMESGRPAPGSPRGTPALTVDQVPTAVRRRPAVRREVPGSPRFKAGQQVRARKINPIGHTRLPRYARGRLGTVLQDHGVFVFPDTAVHGRGENPQRVYTVRFMARELWGDDAHPRDSVSIDMWEDYLERV